MSSVIEAIRAGWDTLIASVTSPGLGLQMTLTGIAVLAAYLVSRLVRRRARVFRAEPEPGPFVYLRTTLHRTRHLVFPTLSVLLLGVAIESSDALIQESWLIRIGQGIAVVFFLYRLISDFVENSIVSALFTWIIIPVATLRVFGWLDDVSLFLDAFSLEVGTIRISLLSLGRTLIAGVLLFWLGGISSTVGKQAIRNRQALDVGTREVITKLFQIGLFVVIFLLLLGAMGINLTALAVFGGALGVGLGFGLQQIAANFISGLIILIDRSITIGDYVEFDDGRAGKIRELNMRSAILETFDGKDVMVPNEQFITLSFVNWTHKNKKQRYSLEFSVSYDTELHEMLRLVKDAVASHPKVLSGPDLPTEEQPDAEISSFGDSGVNILVEFWMEGIDDGENRVGADLLMIIWDVLKANNIEIPFPQRDIRIRQSNPSPS